MVTTRPSLVEWRDAVVVVMIAIAGCAHEPRRSGLGVSAPNPNGCYVFLYDRSDWQGAGVVLNGPARWPKLEGCSARGAKVIAQTTRVPSEMGDDLAIAAIGLTWRLMRRSVRSASSVL